MNEYNRSTQLALQLRCNKSD